MKKIMITNFTDPVCCWCWGTEPIFRALETHYPDQIEFQYITGGLVENIDGFSDTGNGIDGGADGSNAQIISHWLESSERHGMPIRSEGFHLFSKEYPSTYPQNIAYKAAELATPKLADAYLRRLREATLAEAKVTSNLDVQIELASEVGIDIASFIQVIQNGEAEKKFKEDLEFTYSSDVRGFPTFLIKSSEGKQIMLRGYQTFDNFKKIIEYLTGDSLKSVQVTPSIESLNQLLDQHPRLALEEIRQAFDFQSKELTDAWIQELLNEHLITKEIAGNSYFVRKAKSLACDLSTGICE